MLCSINHGLVCSHNTRDFVPTFCDTVSSNKVYIRASTRLVVSWYSDIRAASMRELCRVFLTHDLFSPDKRLA